MNKQIPCPMYEKQFLEHKDLIKKMLKTFYDLGGDNMARIDAPLWHRYYTKKFNKLNSHACIK